MFRTAGMIALPLTFHSEVFGSDPFGIHDPVGAGEPISSSLCFVTSDPVVRTNGVHPSTVAMPLTAAAIAMPAIENLSLKAGEYTVTRRINRQETDLTYVVDEVIPTAAGVSLLVLDPERSQLVSGYDETSFAGEPLGNIPHVGPILRVKYKGRDVTFDVHPAARTMLYSLLPLYGGRV